MDARTYATDQHLKIDADKTSPGLGSVSGPARHPLRRSATPWGADWVGSPGEEEEDDDDDDEEELWWRKKKAGPRPLTPPGSGAEALWQTANLTPVRSLELACVAAWHVCSVMRSEAAA